VTSHRQSDLYDGFYDSPQVLLGVPVMQVLQRVLMNEGVVFPEAGGATGSTLTVPKLHDVVDQMTTSLTFHG
jgi:hypothetical protein